LCGDAGLSEPGNRRSLIMLPYNHTSDAAGDDLAIPADKTVGTDVELKGITVHHHHHHHYHHQSSSSSTSKRVQLKSTLCDHF